MLFAVDENFMVEIILLTLRISLTAALLAAVLGLPLGAVLAFCRFPGRQVLVVLVNTFMSLPPVVVGVGVYLLLSHGGVLGSLEWLFTPAAMVLAQTILALPIVAALSREILNSLWSEYGCLLRSLYASVPQRFLTLLWEGRGQLITAVLAGFGRAISEVGAVLIVGGNIFGQTRVLTTAIAQQASQGELDMALQLGMILLGLALSVNLLMQIMRTRLLPHEVAVP